MLRRISSTSGVTTFFIKSAIYFYEKNTKLADHKAYKAQTKITNYLVEYRPATKLSATRAVAASKQEVLQDEGQRATVVDCFAASSACLCASTWASALTSASAAWVSSMDSARRRGRLT